jgi:uncharacterized membrane protein
MTMEERSGGAPRESAVGVRARRFLPVLVFAGVAFYPVLVLLGLDRVGGRWMGSAVLVLATLRAAMYSGGGGRARWITLPAAGSALGGLVLLHSAVHERESVIERLARLQRGVVKLPPTAARYCRRLTHLWSYFLILNAVIISVLAAAASTGAWALYSGLISYALAGVLMVSEVVYRYWKVKPVADREARELGLID